MQVTHSSSGNGYEPEAREFESLRARLERYRVNLGQILYLVDSSSSFLHLHRPFWPVFDAYCSQTVPKFVVLLRRGIVRLLVPEFGSRLLSCWFALLSVRAGAWFSLVFGTCCSEIVPKRQGIYSWQQSSSTGCCWLTRYPR